MATTVGFVPIAQRIEALARAGEPRPRNPGGARLGGRAGGPHRPRARGAGAGDAGRTNRQIGEELFISTKTASVHVSNILAKLQVAEPRGSGRGRSPSRARPLASRGDGAARRGSRGWQLPLGPAILTDFANTRALNGAEVVLHDLDRERAAAHGRPRERDRAAPEHRDEGPGRSRSAHGARGRRLRRHQLLRRRLRQHAPRSRDPRAVRHRAADRRQRRAGRRDPRAAQHPGAARHRARCRGRRARRVAAERHQPAHRVVPIGHARDERAAPSGCATSG